MEWINFLIGAVPGVIVIVTLAIQLVKYIKKHAKDKNWASLIKLVMNLMSEAEELHDNGADRKTWVLDMTLAGAETIGCDVDVDKIGDLIDSLCAMSKKVNVKGK